MAHILVHHKVEDYNRWKSVFDEHGSFRFENGSKGGKVFRSAKDPNELFILLEWESLDRLEIFSRSEGLKEAMQKSGVVGMPEVYYLEETATSSK